MRRYRVTLQHVYRYSDVIDVEADDEDEAYELTHTQFCLSDSNGEQLDDQNHCVVQRLASDDDAGGETWDA